MRNSRQPRICKHRQEARVWLGRWVTLGVWGSPDVRAAYTREVEAWRREGCPTLRGALPTVVDIATEYLDFIERTRSANVLETARLALRPFCAAYGTFEARAVRPKVIDGWRESLIASGLVRTTINKRVRVVRDMIRWAVHDEALPPECWHLLSTVRGLRRGELGCKDAPRVKPVPRSVVDATLPHVPEVVAAMIRVQLATGMRPGEVCAMRWEEIDRTGDVWIFRPSAHKTAHHGHERVIPLGPVARGVIESAGLRTIGPVFRPTPKWANAEMEISQESRANPARTRARAVKRLNGWTGSREPGEAYTVAAYRRAITRACQSAGVEPWHPNQLRHTRATEIRATAGLDAAAAVLGHSRVETTQVYAEVATARAVEVARASG